LSIAQRWQDIRTGFERPFWVANISEIFERLSFYAAFASLARYLHEGLELPVESATSLAGLFGGAVWFLAIFGGTVADRLGFRRALSLAYFILACAYFLMGSLGAPWMQGVRHAIPIVPLAAFVLLLPAFGIALVKPCVVGTTARASKENVRSIGYSIYYTLVNIGSTAGPYVASTVRKHMAVEKVFTVASISVLAMFVAVLIFFREPRREAGQEVPTFRQVMRNFGTVVTNWRFMLFLIIFSGYWIVFWQQYIILPIYIHDFVNPNVDTELTLIADPLVVILFTMLISIATRKVRAFHAITLGTLISAVAWLVPVLDRSGRTMFNLGGVQLWGAAVIALMVLALGEIIQSPRYYEYISRLAPPGQQGTYMGFAFLPIGIGSLVAGRFGGVLIHHYGEVQHRPERIWWAVTVVGIATALLLWIYDRFVQPAQAIEEAVATVTNEQ
jgi:proton-dependent oligopeptide transporter, POT family